MEEVFEDLQTIDLEIQEVHVEKRGAPISLMPVKFPEANQSKK